jgi:TPR repeat protein
MSEVWAAPLIYINMYVYICIYNSINIYLYIGLVYERGVGCPSDMSSALSQYEYAGKDGHYINMFMYINMHIYMFMYINMHIYMYIYLYIYAYIYMNFYFFIHKQVYIFTCI